MSDTIGSLIDKLTIINLKLWHVQDAVHKAAAGRTALSAEDTARLADLNVQRNNLMDEIDQMLDAACRKGQAPLARRIKIL